VGYKLFLQGIGKLVAFFHGYIGVNALALNIMRETNHGGLGNLRVSHQRAFNFSGAQAVSRDI